MQIENKPTGSLEDVIAVHAIEAKELPNGTDAISGIQRWFEKTRPEKTARDYLAQLACHFEEVAECVDAVGHDCRAVLWIRDRFRELRASCADYGYTGKPLPENWRKDLLDSLCDQIVTAIGVAHCANLDIVGALHEVNASNWSKFENGEPIRDAYGKIIKGRNYKAPVLDQYVLEAPKWVSPKLEAGVVFKAQDGTELVEVLSVGAFRTNTERKLVTYRYVDAGATYVTSEYDSVNALNLTRKLLINNKLLVSYCVY